MSDRPKKSEAQAKARPTLRATLVRANGERVELGTIGSPEAAADIDRVVSNRNPYPADRLIEEQRERDARGH